MGNLPEGVAVDSSTGKVAVGLREPDELAILDGATGRVTERVRLPGAPRHLQLAEPGGPVLVPAEPANQLVQAPLGPGDSEITKVGVQPHDAAQIGERIYVGDERSDTVSVIEGQRRVGRFKVARQPGGVAPPFKRIAKVNAGVGPTHVVSDNENRLYVTDTAGDALLIFQVKPEVKLIRRLAMPTSPYGIALDAKRERLFVTLTGTNKLIKLWTNGPRTVATIPTVKQPDTVAVDETTGRAFVTGRFDGVLQLVDPADR